MTAINTLKERVDYYINLNNPELMRKLPVIIVINGRSFKKTTSLLQKPFCPIFSEAMCAVMIKLAQEVDGCSFVYSFSDEIVLVARNDQTTETGAWYNNKIQKIASVSASIATYEFNRISKMNGMQVFGDPIFHSQTFTVPTIMEAINVLISKQQQAFHNALSMACFYELIKKHSPDIVQQTLIEKSPQAKAEILLEECNIDINSYPLPFRRGCATYRVPRVVSTVEGEEIKNKLTVDMELPLFSKNHEFLQSIIKSGRDILRARNE